MEYRIAVLDDDEKELQRTEALFSRYRETHPQQELEITYFQEMEPFMEAASCQDEVGKWAFDILLMDIYLPDGNGLQSAGILRAAGYGGIIVFKSSTTDNAIEGFMVNAAGYLIKPVGQEEFDETINRAAKKVGQNALEPAGRRIIILPADSEEGKEKESEGRKPFGRMIKSMMEKILADE